MFAARQKKRRPVSAVFLCVRFNDAFAGKPAPTLDRIPNVGAGLLAKEPSWAVKMRMPRAIQ
ncbi:hypothetical protein C6Y56_15540 [Pseudomonas fluorescens]|uniref:Uncharacterized protein n=1 Tax=Pseudomonas fluorescens TaxID=294 RepID=A0A7Z3C6X6_PSEFL|nr:hypothetical protein C6Y56_15540 [Pseudomonas fluorescens]